MKYYIIAGEASGDLHASNLMNGIMSIDSDAQFRFFGGDLMAKQGGVLVKHYREMAFMGFWEVIKNLRQISRNLKLCKDDILNYNPDAVILVDYPGFNLRIAKFAKLAGFKVFYYISPKVWAWKESRVKDLKVFVDKLIVIFPFEVQYFKERGIDVIFEGNPLNDSIGRASNSDDFLISNNLSSKPIISLLAGSRKQEIKYNLPVMLSLVDMLKDFQFVIAGAPSLSMEIYQPYIKNKDVKVVFGKTYDLLKNSSLAVVTSGTATLEAAMLNVPEVVCYRGSFLSMIIAWIVIKVKYISLVNLIMDKEVVKELIQYKLSPSSLLNKVKSLLPGQPKREKMLQDFSNLKHMLGESGTSKRVAGRIIEYLKS
ncbi:MAG: lipid-A-disaccharide synthase [Bacteroidetes bacterium HGW-Bacteroidetes-12]|nr:MAG: lipid-A-disaccharide synthase [Bacteroidetes bacterium HGW-Bacteroidetes-12]